jgi:hypothetical protein
MAITGLSAFPDRTALDLMLGDFAEIDNRLRRHRRFVLIGVYLNYPRLDLQIEGNSQLKPAVGLPDWRPAIL